MRVHAIVRTLRAVSTHSRPHGVGALYARRHRAAAIVQLTLVDVRAALAVARVACSDQQQLMTSHDNNIKACTKCVNDKMMYGLQVNIRTSTYERSDMGSLGDMAHKLA